MQVENVECMEEPANHLKFDFLGKDSIRYENEVEVEEKVWQLVKRFCRKNADGKGTFSFIPLPGWGGATALCSYAKRV